jgi:hypothetical protein
MGTCSTCLHWDEYPDNKGECLHLGKSEESGLYVSCFDESMVITLGTFGCTKHQESGE